MKKVRLAALFLAVAMSVSACGNSSDNNASTQNSSAASSEAATQATTAATTESLKVTYPVTVTDQAGRTVTIEKEPTKLVSGYYISTSLLIALDLDDKMVGIEAKANKRPLYKLSAKKIIDLPSVGTAKEFDLEGCIALQPDLVILPLKLKSAAESLEKVGIKAILVNPESEKLLDEMIEVVSTATNTKEKAKDLVSFIDDKKQVLANATKSEEAKTVYLAGNSSVLSTAGKNMYQSSMIAMAGGKNVAESIEDKSWAETSYEQILAWDPEYIIIAADAEYPVAEVLSNAALANCKAVKNGKVYKLPSDVEAWDSPVPSGILGSVWVANVLHPEAVSDKTAESIFEEFYERFYNFKYSEK